MIHEKHDKAQTVTGVAEAFADLGGQNGAGVFVMSHFLSPTRVMHQQCDVDGDGILHVLENFAEELLLGIL